MMKTLAFFVLSFFGFVLVAQNRPNIVLIISDDHAYQTIHAYNPQPYNKTPAIDRIASEGVLFNKAYVTNSICGPSRACILTGKYSCENGFRDNETSHYDSSQNQFVNELQRAGYQTAWIGKYHLGDDPKGFDHYEILKGQGYYYNPDFILPGKKIIRREGYVADLVEDAAEQWLDQRDTNKPFMLIIGHKNTHRTWMPALEDLGAYDNVNFPLPSTFFDDYKGREAAQQQDMNIANTMIMGYDLKMFPTEEDANADKNIARMTPTQRKKWDAYYNPINQALKKAKMSKNELTLWKYQRYMRDYFSTALSLDRNIARTLDYLDKHQLTDNTIVIYMSDQGFYMGEHGWFDKRFMYEQSFRTPMVMRYPKQVKAGQVNNDFVMNIDIAPTLLQVAGIPIPKDIQGKSFLNAVEGKPNTPRQYMYYHYYENGEHAVSPHFGVRSKRYKLIHFYKRVNSWEFYDLEKDPSELNNLYGDPAYKTQIKQMKSVLSNLIKTYKDKDAQLILKADKSV